ncbi:MAG: nucleotidyltransferase domain-containing protein [Candidatus Thorarchaeota archaeon]
MPSKPQEQSSTTARIKYRRINYREVLVALQSYAKELVHTNKAQLVLLFGSLARGNYTGSSDADLLIIAEKASDRHLDRYSEFLDPTLPIEISPIVLKRKECKKRLVAADPFLATAISQSLFLAGERDLYTEFHTMTSSQET